MRHLATAQNFHPSLATTISFPSRHWRINVFFTSLPLSFILSLPLLGVSFLPFPDVCKNDVEENRERQRGTRKADEWRHILLKTKRRGWNKYTSVRSSPLPLLFFIRFYFLFFSPPFFSFHVEIEVLLFPFVLRYSSSSSVLLTATPEWTKKER